MKKSDKNDTKQAVDKTNKKKQLFLEALEKKTFGASVLDACKIARVNRQYMYRLRAEDPNFARQWDMAIADGHQTLHDLALSAIYEHLKNMDKTVAMFVLRQLDPQTWNKDRERVGENAGPVQMTHKVSPRFAKIMEGVLNDTRKSMTSTPQIDKIRVKL
ncbi:MAG TPA: hypothetical protein VG965_04620 [Patescibacteria group bacterium]|nr:hypothetical protein [Patescibacteria group bacterium]